MRAFSKRADVKIALAVLALAAFSPAATAVAMPASSGAVAVQSLASQIEAAVLAAISGAPMNADTIASATSSVESVIALSGVDPDSAMAALAKARIDLIARGDRDALMALNAVTNSVQSTLMTVSVSSHGHGAPPPGRPPAGPPPGQGGYHPPHP